MSDGIPGTAIQTVAQLGLLILIGAALIALYRLIRGPTPADRVLALDLMSILASGLLALRAIVEHQIAYLDVAIVVALLTFLATVGFARYLAGRPAPEE